MKQLLEYFLLRNYLLKDIEPKIDIDFNKFSTQLIFVLIIIVLWPIIFLSKND